MILICGIPSEPAITMVWEQLKKLGIPYVIFNQRQFGNVEFEFQIKKGLVTGLLTINGLQFCIENFTGVYQRLMDFRHLPELAGESPDSIKWKYCRALHDMLMRWFQITPARVITRPISLGSNFSKPYQAQIIQKYGFMVPKTLITNDPNLVLEFRRRYKQVVYKSISAVRSIVQTLEDSDLWRLENILWCPTQFQEFVEGSNIRVHVVGDHIFATDIGSSTTDYRYSFMNGEQTNLRAIRIPPELEDKCIKLSKALGLDVSGIDLKITPENKIYCFEVNPSPAFTYYEVQTGQPISKAIARYLAGLK